MYFKAKNISGTGNVYAKYFIFSSKLFGDPWKISLDTLRGTNPQVENH